MGNIQTALTAGLAELTLKVKMCLKTYKESVTKMKIEAVFTWVLPNSIDF